MRSSGSATARQARLAAARRDEEQRRADARRAKAAASARPQYYTDPLLSDPFLPAPPEAYVEANVGIDADIDAVLNADVRALRKKPKIAFDRFEIRSLSAARMDAVRLPDIAQASRNMAVHDAQRRARLKRSAKLLEGTTFLSKEQIQQMIEPLTTAAATAGSSSKAGPIRVGPLSSTHSTSANSAASSSSSSNLAGPGKEPNIWKSSTIAPAISHHRSLWLGWVMEHERSTADITLSNDIDNEPSPPWDWCFTDQYIPHNLTSHRDRHTSSGREAAPPLRGCSCEDDSCDPATCECFARLKLMDPITWSAETDFAYTRNGRLRNGHFEQCVILECNDSCGCSASCRNRLVQHGRTVPLDVFKTAHCGWGVRAKSLIPKNSFIAAYAGELIDAAGMHERGKRYSKTATTYQLDIDSFHIRCLTRIGPFNEWRTQQGLEPMDPALEETYAAADEWWAEHDPDHVDPILTVDAGLWGNLTRFFNHSCDPNIDMYPVYTDSQDIMRPYLAFFARRDIPAGQELRFNYNGDLADEVSVRPLDIAPAFLSTQSEAGNGKNQSRSKATARGNSRNGRADGTQDDDEDDDGGEADGNQGAHSRQKAMAKERRRQTLLMQQDTASKNKKKQNQDRLLVGIESPRSGAKQRGVSGAGATAAALGKRANELRGAGSLASASSPSSKASTASTPTPTTTTTAAAARSLGAMMAELVPSGSREVELVDGVKAMVCRCGAPNCKGQVFT
ncbi:hypothetical protein OC835_001196 [Tilletia horrida]|uniref:SET domain-containing protein n=1 Tax=Tilletia horrida TaxID=155126 RepID=A0AAN6GDM5_9BASI|nr:hypothetical protein OC842_002242 [Tilletia horrida]KAK0539249.1 hypothetical protein OC835_001196 [Tilletia horrida]